MAKNSTLMVSNKKIAIQKKTSKRFSVKAASV